jgi:hypothetical protein
VRKEKTAMRVHELCEMLANCNQEAMVVVSRECQIGDYTWDTDETDVTGIIAWPEPCETADRIELTYDDGDSGDT